MDNRNYDPQFESLKVFWESQEQRLRLLSGIRITDEILKQTAAFGDSEIAVFEKLMNTQKTLAGLMEHSSAAVAAEAAPVVEVPVVVEAAPVAAAPAVAGGKITEVILAAIADKTGYPEDMIDNDMELEADLGIDSIKRVEIFADVIRQLGINLTAEQTEELSGLSTVEAIQNYLSALV